MRLWIDLANAPHATFFRPVVTELRRRDHSVFLTAWDRGRAVELARRFWPDTVVIGEGAGYRSPVVAKGAAIWQRAARLRDLVAAERFDLALSHGSYSQLLAARMTRLPSVTLMDYEHQPANHLAFRLADLVVLPEVIPFDVVRRFGLTERRTIRYPGVKEAITLSDFAPQPDFRRELAVDDDEIMAVARPAATGALYHREDNELFRRVVTGLADHGATVIVSPRTGTQARQLDFGNRARIRVLEDVVSGADLLFHADLVIGAGGTMTREAAVLGTPVWTVFQGRDASVDQWLIDVGRLRRLSGPLSPELIRPKPAARPPRPLPELVRGFVDRLEESFRAARHRHPAAARTARRPGPARIAAAACSPPRRDG